MPHKRPHRCHANGCKNLTVSTYCDRHKKERRSPDTRGNAQSRGYGADWSAVSKRVLKRDRFECRLGYDGCTGRAQLAHHEPPISGPDDPDRLNPDRCIASCRHCHEVRHGRKR